MHFLRRSLWALVLCTAPTLSILASDLDTCRGRFLEAPGTREPGLCFYELARQGVVPPKVIEQELTTLSREHPEDAWLQHYLAVTLRRYMKGDPRIEPLSRAAAERFGELDEYHGEYFARNALRKHLVHRGRVEEAVEQIRLLRESLGASDDPEIQGRLDLMEAQQLFSERKDLGRAYRLSQEAVDHLSQALRDLEASAPESDQQADATALDNVLRPLGSALAYQASIALELGRPREALRHYKQAARQAEDRGDRASAVVNRGNIPLAMAALYEREPSETLHRESREAARAALDVARTLGEPDTEARIRLELAKLVGLPGGSSHFETCIELAKTLEQSKRRNSLLGECLAPYALALADTAPEEALEVRRQAVEAAQRGQDIRVLAQVLEVGSRVSWKVLSPPEALEDSLEALDAIEALRDLQTGTPGRTRLFSEWASAYQRLFGYLVQTYRRTGDVVFLERAVEVSERMRSRALQEALDWTAASVEPPPALLARRRLVLDQMRSLQNRLLREEPSPETRRAWVGELERLEWDLGEAQHEIREVQFQTTELPEPRFASLRDVRNTLDSNEALLLYQIAPDDDIYGHFAGGSWAVAVTRDQLVAQPLGHVDSLHWRLPALLGLIEGRRDAPPASVARLFEDLLAPILDELPQEVDTLVLLPDGPLHSMPFSLLRTPRDPTPLGLRYRLLRIPSATLWHRWRTRPSPSGSRPALVFADPEPTRTMPSRSISLRSAPVTPERLSPLPLAREEGRSLVRHLGRGVVLREGSEATENAIKSLPLREFRMVHLAAHAQADVKNPESSAIYLTPDATDVDGLLQFREIVDLDLEGRVIVLSACDTATGEILRGEGVLDLARAFFQAGAHAVVASLWPLRDDDARDFFDAFYRRLAAGGSLAGALQDAQLERRAAGAPAAAWAGIVVLGDGMLTPFPDSEHRWPFSLAVVLGFGLLSLAGVVAGIRRIS